ncbi:unnamed protein product [Meloidogyne enterolobii]|uniref:Uncharacterized protein n=1 Tax=Meloidogyne enterolobii TaxID=390850 RepID=A0ACB1B8G4_MELEN
MGTSTTSIKTTDFGSRNIQFLARSWIRLMDTRQTSSRRTNFSWHYNVNWTCFTRRIPLHATIANIPNLSTNGQNNYHLCNFGTSSSSQYNNNRQTRTNFVCAYIAETYIWMESLWNRLRFD